MVKFTYILRNGGDKVVYEDSGSLNLLDAAKKFNKFCDDHFDPEEGFKQKSDGNRVVITASNNDSLELIFATSEEREEIVG